VDGKSVQSVGPSKEAGSRWVKISVALVAVATTVLFIMPLSPAFPGVGLDLSWEYALNEAVAGHLVFGRDIVFTLGPLGFVFANMYHPATNWILLLVSALVGAGLGVGCALLAYPTKPVHVTILPFVVAEISLRDSIFIFLPFVLLVLILRVCAPRDSKQYLRPSPLICTGIAIVICSVALLTLVKGSYVGSAFFSGGLSVLVLLRRHPLAAAAFAGLAVATAAGAWVVAGQPISALSTFFIAQGPIISGFPLAMSLDGSHKEVVIYAVISVALLGLFHREFARHFGKTGLIAVASFAFTLFVCFKAAFVRHDQHGATAAGALLLAGYCVSAMSESVLYLLVWVLAVFGWAKIDRAHSGLDVAMASQRIHDAIISTYEGIKLRLGSPQLVRNVFDQANAAIREEHPLPPIKGNVDVYPSELSPIFAYGFHWAPRPVFQSYSAYDASLDALNSGHLEEPNAPQHVFFRLQPIDNRLPALEDAGSWPLLLSHYKIVGYDGLQIHMQRVDDGQPNLVFGTPLTRLTAHIGTPVQIPKEEGPIWAEIEMTPTFFGRVCLFVWKIPPVEATLTLADGRVVHRRYIPPMGYRGFLLSPYIQTTDDFADLAVGIHQGNAVRSIQFDTPDTGMWRRQFNMRLRRLTTDSQPGARKIVLIQPSEPPPALAEPAINRAVECQIESLNGSAANIDRGVISAQDALQVEGWSVVSARDGIAPDAVWIVLTSSDQRRHFYRAIQESRPDIKAALGHPNMKDPGFVANLDLEGLTGLQKLNVYEISGNVAFDCALDRTVNVASRQGW
jgi:hypothetical protein